MKVAEYLGLYFFSLYRYNLDFSQLILLVPLRCFSIFPGLMLYLFGFLLFCLLVLCNFRLFTYLVVCLNCRIWYLLRFSCTSIWSGLCCKWFMVRPWDVAIEGSWVKYGLWISDFYVERLVVMVRSMLFGE